MKFILDNIWLIAIAVVSGGALLFPAILRGGKKISILQATQLTNAGKAVIVDVREPAEWNAGHVRDAKHIPLGELERRAGELEKWKSATVITMCQTGARSGRALGMLKKAGFTDVASLDGGIEAWQSQGLPLAK